MTLQQTGNTSRQRRPLFPAWKIGRPPIPHEHGAWIILCAPLILGFAAAPRFSPLPSLLLLLTVTGLFLSRPLVGMLLRQRGRPESAFWLGVYLLASATGALSLLLAYRSYALIWLGLPMGLLFLIHLGLQLKPSRRRLDRSLWGEILAVGALTLTAPAGVVAGGGALNADTWRLWALCALYFSSGIFYVKMLLAALAVKGSFGKQERRRIGREQRVYHALLPALVGVLCIGCPLLKIALIELAIVPVMVRAYVGEARLTNRTPSFKRVGMLESLYALWFTLCILLSHRVSM
jgi:hypothetical protein